MKKITGHAAVVALALILGVAGSAGTGLADYTWLSYMGHAYALTETAGSWAAAEAEAFALGYHLVAINDVHEQVWIESNLLELYRWIGFHEVGGTWVWSNGDAGGYDNWLAEYPDVAPPDYNYATIFYEELGDENYHGKWVNFGVSDFASFRGVIESDGGVVPLPSALLLLGLGLVRLAVWARRRS